MGKGSNTTTTQQNQSYTPAGAGYIQNALQQGQAAAQLPFNIPQAPVAGFSQDQLSAFQNVNNAQGMAQPYINQANNYFQQSAQRPDVSQFFNPMVGAVSNQLQNIFGQQQSQATGQLTQAAGGVGADRIAVGQANLANQQGLAAGQTFAGLYAQAQQAAQQQQSMLQSAGYGTAALGSQAQNAALTGAQAQLGTGGLQQQLAQAQLNAPYQRQLAQAAFPYQQAQFNAGITGALAPGLGGTTTGFGQTTAPPPSMLSQILGLGTAGVGAAGAFGAFGGPSQTDQYGGFSPANGGEYGGSAKAPLDGLSASDYGKGAAAGGRVPMFADGGMFSLPQGFNDKPIDVDQEHVIPQEQLAPAQVHMPNLNLNPPAASGKSGSGDAAAIVGDVAKIAGMFLKRGGIANPKFAEGGDIDILRNAMLQHGYQPNDFNNRFPATTSIGPVDAIGGASPQSAGAYPSGSPFNPYRMTSPDTVTADASKDEGPAQGGTSTEGTLPPPSQAAPGQGGPALAPPQQGPGPQAEPPAEEDKSSKIAKNPWMALMAAGLGIAGGTSPFAAVNIGQGGLQGIKALEEQRGAAQKDEAVKQAAHRLELERQQIEAKERYQQFEMNKPFPIGQRYDPNTGMPMTTYGKFDEKGNIVPAQGPTPTATDASGNAVKPMHESIGDAIISGEQMPTLQGLYRQGPAVRAYLERKHFNLAQAQLEQKAAEKQVAVLNGPQTMRLIGLSKSVDNSIDEVKRLAAQLHNSGVPLINQIKLQSLINTEGNSPRGQLATSYMTAINTVKSEFANAEAGGYAPHESVWQLANQQINGNYGEEQINANLGEVQRLLRYRINAIPNIGTLGPNAANRYIGTTGQPATPPAGGAGEAWPAPPPHDIATLRGDSSAKRRQQFDFHYGPGAADKILGAP